MVAPQPAQAVPPSTYAYVANFIDDTVSVINTATNTVVATVPVDDLPFGVAFGVVPRPAPALTLIKLTAGGTFTQGGQGTYTLTATNTGDLPTDGSTVTLPTGQTPVSFSGTGWTCPSPRCPAPAATSSPPASATRPSPLPSRSPPTRRSRSPTPTPTPPPPPPPSPAAGRIGHPADPGSLTRVQQIQLASRRGVRRREREQDGGHRPLETGEQSSGVGSAQVVSVRASTISGMARSWTRLHEHLGAAPGPLDFAMVRSDTIRLV
ncbi:hypothetical protein ACTU45_33280 [Streptomyces sp. 24-1644]|uniref:hypothetical protein n=1 Tax=Streptomyces sp. 24-1644 TaxID=3457315 RepID=UPI003FA744FB